MKNAKLLHLEGLRGFAALIVFFHHLGLFFLFPLKSQVYTKIKGVFGDTYISKGLSGLFNFFVDGEIAVYIFWFMSAYVISIKLFQKNDINYVKSVISKRYFRLLIPALGSVLLAYFLLRFGWMYNMELGTKNANEWLTRFYYFEADFWFAMKSGIWDTFFNYDYKTTYNSVLWTMNPELYGSLCCFVLFAILRLHRLRYYAYGFLIIGSFLLSYTLKNHYWLSTFLIGFVLCDIDHTKNRFKAYIPHIKRMFSKLFLVLFLLACFIAVRNLTQHRIVCALISVGIVFLVLHAKVLTQLFSKRIFVWLGKISFSFYLIHFPIICSLSCFMHLHIDMPPTAKFLIISSCTLAVSLAASWVFYKLFDRWSIKISGAIGRLFS